MKVVTNQDLTNGVGGRGEWPRHTVEALYCTSTCRPYSRDGEATASLIGDGAGSSSIVAVAMEEDRPLSQN